MMEQRMYVVHVNRMAPSDASEVETAIPGWSSLPIGHGSLTTTQRYLHPDQRSILIAGQALSAHFGAS
jgi:hypothetical protein